MNDHDPHPMLSNTNSPPTSPIMESQPETNSSPTDTNPSPINANKEDREINNKKLTSPVWEHYTREKIKGELKAVCNYCGKVLGAKPRGGTSHLHEHLKRCPMRKHADIKQKLLTTSLDKVNGKVKVNSYTFDQETSRRELANMIIMHEHPLSIVDQVGFKRFVGTLQPLFKMVSRNTIKSDILKIYDYEREKTMKLVENNQGRVAITTDMWTSSNQNKGFMAITTHFIDDSWTLQSRILRFIYVPCPHTKDVLCEELISCLFEWNVDRKISTMTVDNCSTNDAMIDSLIYKLDTSILLLDGNFFHMRCCAHILNLIVKDGLNVIKEGIERIRDSVAYWSASPKREEKFEEVVRQLHIRSTKKLGLDCATRWNSTYLMLETALIYKDVFPRLKHFDSLYKTLPNEKDWKFAQEICGRLKLFYNVTEIFSGTKYPTANLYFPKICEIRMALCEWITCSNEIVRSMTANMMRKYDKYWIIIHGIMGVAAVLDPRYKMKLIHLYFPKLYGNEASIEIEKIQKICYDLVEEYKFKNSQNGIYEETFRTSSSQSGVCDLREKDVLSDYDLFVSMEQETLHLNVKSELDHYLEEGVLPRTQDFDILNWWKSNGLKYPTLQAIARDILAIPVFTVSSESAFSTSGRLVSPHRNRLHPKTMEALMCAQNWLWAAEMKGSSQESCGYATIYDDLDVEESA